MWTFALACTLSIALFGWIMYPRRQNAIDRPSTSDYRQVTDEMASEETVSEAKEDPSTGQDVHADSLKIFYGTQTGTAKNYAERLLAAFEKEDQNEDGAMTSMKETYGLSSIQVILFSIFFGLLLWCWYTNIRTSATRMITPEMISRSQGNSCFSLKNSLL